MERRQLYQTWKTIMFLFLFGMISGCAYFHLISIIKGTVFVNEWGIIVDKYINWSIQSCFVLKQRYIDWLLLFHTMIAVCGFFKWGKIVLGGLYFSIGLLAGSLETVLLLCYELKKKLFFEIKWLAVTMIPVTLSVMAIVLAYSMSVTGIRYVNNETKKYLMYIFFVFVLDVVYIFAVSYVNL